MPLAGPERAGRTASSTLEKVRFGPRASRRPERLRSRWAISEARATPTWTPSCSSRTRSSEGPRPRCSRCRGWHLRPGRACARAAGRALTNSSMRSTTWVALPYQSGRVQQVHDDAGDLLGRAAGVGLDPVVGPGLSPEDGVTRPGRQTGPLGQGQDRGGHDPLLDPHEHDHGERDHAPGRTRQR